MVLRYLALVVLLTINVQSAYAIDVNRPEVRSFIDKMVQEHQFSRKQVKAVLRNAQTQQAILDAISKPAERTIPWYDYRERFLTERRIRKGGEFATAHAATLNRLAAAGAPVNVILGILGVETMYGDITGRYRVIDALATLGFDYAPRSAYFLSELEQFLLLAREQKLVIKNVQGSYAGAMGPPQFMPHSYREFAVDGDNDGKINLWNDWDDVLASIANYLKQFDWHPGEPVLADATYVGSDAATASPAYSTGDIALNETVASLRAKGFNFTTSLPDTAPAMLITLQAQGGPLYRVGFNNFYVITRYNRSPLYVNAVYELGQAVAAQTQVTTP
jgi:membrane-bound lytic murein transglycosylase B